MAPSTPPPPSKELFAALTIASTARVVMSALMACRFVIQGEVKAVKVIRIPYSAAHESRWRTHAPLALSLLQIKFKNLLVAPVNSHPNNVVTLGVARSDLPDVLNHTIDRYRIQFND